MTTPPVHPEPFTIEIVVDGEVRTTFLASEFKVTETRESLTLGAERWLATLTLPPNPVFDPPGGPVPTNNPLIAGKDQS